MRATHVTAKHAGASNLTQNMAQARKHGTMHKRLSKYSACPYSLCDNHARRNIVSHSRNSHQNKQDGVAMCGTMLL